MAISCVRLLEKQRALYDLAPGRERFEAYLQLMLMDDRSTTRYPLGIINPMGKSHVAEYYDALLALDAEAIADDVLADALDFGESYRLALVVADDRAGGWTNRYADEHALRFPESLTPNHGADWLIAVFWTNDAPPTRERIRAEVRATVLRRSYMRRNGCARTLRDKLRQEGEVLMRAEVPVPMLADEEREWTRWIIEDRFDSTDMRTAVQVLFGDAAGATLGFEPLGLGDSAGLGWAVCDALARLTSPPVVGEPTPA